MTGLPKHNYPAFNKATRKLRRAGYKVVNPAELDEKLLVSWEEGLRRDLTAICQQCYAIATLPNWTKSRGAQLEIYVAKELDIPVHTVEYWLKNKEEAI